VRELIDLKIIGYTPICGTGRNCTLVVLTELIFAAHNWYKDLFKQHHWKQEVFLVKHMKFMTWDYIRREKEITDFTILLLVCSVKREYEFYM